MSRMLPEQYDVLAPDGSEVRILASSGRGSMAHFTLGPDQISAAVRHHTVEEIWYVLSGHGRMWMKRDADEFMLSLQPGLSFSIAAGTAFQFRCDSDYPLRAVAVTMPPWTGMDEAVGVAGKWEPNL